MFFDSELAKQNEKENDYWYNGNPQRQKIGVYNKTVNLPLSLRY